MYMYWLISAFTGIASDGPDLTAQYYDGDTTQYHDSQILDASRFLYDLMLRNAY